jgi:hypothetical protein
MTAPKHGEYWLLRTQWDSLVVGQADVAFPSSRHPNKVDWWLAGFEDAEDGERFTPIKRVWPDAES